jgi:hypothetical protein
MMSPFPASFGSHGRIHDVTPGRRKRRGLALPRRQIARLNPEVP